jgi:vancomycin resistance protein YoaR
MNKRIKYFWMGALLAAIVIPLVVGVAYLMTYRGRVFPGVLMAYVPVGGMSRSELEILMTNRVNEYKTHWPVKLTYGQYQWLIPFPEEKLTYQVDKTIDQAYGVGRQGDVLKQLVEIYQAWNTPVNQPISYELDSAWLKAITASISADLNKDVIQPSLLVNDGKITYQDGEMGQFFDSQRFIDRVKGSLGLLEGWTMDDLVRIQEVGVTEMEKAEAITKAEKLLGKELKVSEASEAGAMSWKLKGSDLVGFVEIKGGYDQTKLKDYLVEVSGVINRPPQNAKFQFNEPEKKVEEFVPAKDGLEVDATASAKLVAQAIEKLVTDKNTDPVILVVKKTKPEISLDQVNDLGLKELLGKGESTYFHSILTRVHNVGLAASRINGTLVKPGETFSFNEALGEVSGATGYKQAYVIRAGRTELGDGGGVCQDSTTVFRAALNAGLPIVERRAHAYRVGYYEQNTKAGIDATVYAPSPDLKILNDTPAHILIQTINDAPNRHLTVEIYGTSDGRKAEILNHVVWGITPPLPDVFVDDPTLPVGQTKQIDWAAAGAKAKFNYRVTRGEVIILEKTFTSNYKPWASVYLRGTK